ncbi:MAG: D-glycero-beta-D-manno-heptose-1,7-bisphosphate 7-phosphatase [Candidatus Omnitrophota bacterium]|nr:MAG: D-glycero-beta-D-manno-heptose-1,7-bisphosphate 7-phosphatase [Candidatus Omnitrophota bacterium]HDN97636.1 D-glycero-beta-D-manno-heptose 1,7-bisphosphate 7-phosphatase [bacterium]
MKVVFLDRDGVISKYIEGDYIKKWEEFEFVPGAIEGLKILYKNGYKLVIISNQAGINKGLFTMEQLNEVTEMMKKELGKHGIKLEKVYYCPHTEEENCNCRKPKPGMFLKAKEELGIDELKGLFFIGDSETDIEAGKNLGLKTILVLSGRTKRNEVEKMKIKPDFVAENLKDAAEIVIKNGKI